MGVGKKNDLWRHAGAMPGMSLKFKNRAAAPAHLQTKTELRVQRMKPGIAQRPVGHYWQGQSYVALYDPADAAPMRPRREPSPLQAAALAAGRALVGTALCGCGKRMDKTELDKRGRCPECVLQEQRDEWVRELRSVHESAASILAQEPLFIDTETTGVDDQAEVIEIAILDHLGKLLLHTLVQPAGPISAEASAIHGITDLDVATAPTWTAIGERVAALLSGRLVVAHNAQFDRRMLRQTYGRHGGQVPEFQSACTMELLTGLNYGRWPRLSVAVQIAGARASSGQAHRATNDAETCRQIILALARQTGPIAG